MVHPSSFPSYRLRAMRSIIVRLFETEWRYVYVCEAPLPSRVVKGYNTRRMKFAACRLNNVGAGQKEAAGGQAH
jgi:hypothetical protein